MILAAIHRIKPITLLYIRFGGSWCKRKLSTAYPFLSQNESILDIGAGNCQVAKILQEDGFQTTAIDVSDCSIYPEWTPQIYDGHTLPCENQSFDTGLLLTVLHHCQSPETVLKEAIRVSKQVIIIEDTYQHFWQKFITQYMDLLVNLFHSEMTFNNRSTQEWEALFAANKWILKDKKQKKVLLFFTQTTFVVTQNSKM